MTGRGLATALRLAPLVALLSAATGCEPCAGVVACRGSETISYSGRIIDFETGHGVPGVAVVFQRDGGVSLAGDSLAARTDAEGRFHLFAQVSERGDVVGHVRVTGNNAARSYVVAHVDLRTSDVRGAGGVLDTWTAEPYVAWVGSVLDRRSGAVAAYAGGTFHRTSGARLAGGDDIAVGLDPSGYFFIRSAALDTGVVVGDLQVGGGSTLARSYLVQGVQLPVQFVDRVPVLNRVLHVGASLEYALELRQRGNWSPIVGADVEFRRTGGIALASDVVSARTTAEGRVRLAPVPAGERAGEVVGDVTVRAVGLARPYVLRNVRLATFDSDELRFAGVFGVGYAVQSAGELVFRGDQSPLTAADVTFTRTAGPAGTSVAATVRPLASGAFGISLATDTAGDVVGDLVVRRDGGSTSTTFRGIHVRATDDDSVRYVGRYAVGQQFSYAGVLVHRATGLPATGWTVAFRRTGGIPLVDDTLVSTVLDWGGFGLSPATRSEGTVDGTLVARSPGGDETISLGAVRLATFDGDEVRLASRWAVGPSLLYVAELRRDDTNGLVVGARAEFRRTGGIRTVESAVGEVSNQFGRFRMAPTPLERGEVVGDLYVFPPSPLRDTVFRDVRMVTFESDETRLHSVWTLAGPKR